MGFKIIVDKPAKQEWITIEGPMERDLVDKTADQVSVRVQVPEGTPEAQYTFRLQVYSTKEPGEHFTTSETVAFKVLSPTTETEEKDEEKKSWWWIPVVIASVLVIGGGITWALWPKNVEIPQLVGQPRDEAEDAITNAGLRVGLVTTQVDNKAVLDSVIKQEPPAGQEVEKDTQVNLWVAIGQPVDPGAEKRPICKRYAQTAINQNMENLKRSCGFTGNRWVSTYDIHYNWCMKGENYKKNAQAETNTRKTLLAKQCKPKPRVDTKKQKICKDYAATAVDQNKVNLRRSCGFKGNRWQSNNKAHYDWCMKGNNSTTNAPKETSARKKSLDNYCSITIYQHADYKGASKKFYPGKYDMKQLGIGNDVLSSISIPNGMAVRVYEHWHFSGKSQEYVKSTKNVGKAWNDRVSSIHVYNKR